MENNEISTCMDVKLDIHNKRPESLKFKTWTRCLVKIEAIKCVPSFLRISLIRLPQLRQENKKLLAERTEIGGSGFDAEPCFRFPINILGVSVSQTESRTKPYSYGVFWKQNRRDCFIYFGVENENVFKRHLKWIKKSIKNLELHRQLFLEQRRNSRESMRLIKIDGNNEKEDNGNKSTVLDILGPLPNVPDSNLSSFWSPRRSSRISGIYEEILDGENPEESSPSLSRRCSRSSIASGIYEEMKPIPSGNFNAIVEELVGGAADATSPPTPPPVPPLPPPRKRMNTFETELGLLGEIPRSNTNPESEIAKKKKYKNMLDTIFGGVGRSKRAVSVSESTACSVNDLLEDNAREYVNSNELREDKTPYPSHPENDIKLNAESKRNSISSPDLSKVNFIENFDDDHAFQFVRNSFANGVDLHCDSESDDENIKRISKADTKVLGINERRKKRLSVSEEIASNFNCSAYNSSSINLIGAIGMNQEQTKKRNEMLTDDMTGYCIMAPIPEKNQTTNINSEPIAKSTQSILTSGYGTAGSSSTSPSTTSSTCANSTEQNALMWPPPNENNGGASAATDESVIYEKMVAGVETDHDVLYENILAMKAAQELEGKWEEESITLTPPNKDSTSTPTYKNDDDCENVEDSFYQTPRRSIVGVDEKISSYYPNTNDRIKMARKAYTHSDKNHPMVDRMGAVVNVTKTFNRSPCDLISNKIRSELKENFVSPSKTGKSPIDAKSSTCRKTTVHKISEHIYNVSHGKKGPKNNRKSNSPACETDADTHAKLQRELLQLVALQNIDFKFDDHQHITEIIAPNESPTRISHEESRNCCPAKTKCRDFIEKYATVALTSSTKSPATICGYDTPQHHLLQQNQQMNTQYPQQHPNLSPNDQGISGPVVTPACEPSVKKFSSLPRFKKFDFSPLRWKINNVLQRNQVQQTQQQELA